MKDIKLKSTRNDSAIRGGYSNIDLANDSSTLGLFATVWQDRDGERGRRMIACWNACKGLHTDTLELSAAGPSVKEWFEAWGEYHRLLNKLDELTSNTDGLIATLQESLAATAEQRDELRTALSHVFDCLPIGDLGARMFPTSAAHAADFNAALDSARVAIAKAKGGAA